MAPTLEELVKETRHAFIIAKSDGELDASEVIQIAVDLSQKIQKVEGLSGEEKKSLLLLSLKRGLDAAGGVDSLPGFANASEEIKKAFENQLITAASSAVDVMIAAANGKIEFKKLADKKSCIPTCVNIAKSVLPKDQKLVQDALKYAESLVKKTEEPEVKPADVAVAVTVAVETTGAAKTK
jgi:hypothetical protein